jgi:hypothetical protein
MKINNKKAMPYFYLLQHGVFLEDFQVNF